MIIGSKFDEDWKKTGSRVFTSFFFDLAYWPSFWPDMTHIPNWPRYCLDDHWEQVLMKIGQKLWPLECSQGFSMILAYWPSFLTQHDSYLNLTQISSRQTFWQIFMMIGCIMWPVLCSQGFSIIWPIDLVFDQTWLIFEFDQDIV